MLLEVLPKTAHKWGFYSPFKKTSRWLQLWSDLTIRSTGRSTGQRSNFDRCQPPVDRPYPRVRGLQSVDRTVDRPKPMAFVHVSCTSGRPFRSTGSWSGRPARSTTRAWQKQFIGLKNLVFNSQLNPINYLKIHKNKFSIIH